MTAFPFLGGSFNGRSPSFDAQRTINLYFEPSESGTSRSDGMLIGTPGCNPWLALSGGGIRGMIRFQTQIAVVVAGDTVWKIADDKTATNIGTIDNLTPTVSMASNGSAIMLVTGITGYFIDPLAGTTTLITDPDFQGGSRVDYIDGYFVWNDPNTGKFQISQILGTDIDALDFVTAEAAPDNIVTLIADHRELWLLGEDTIEVWYDAGNPDFPFQRIQGAFLEVGCAAAMSVAKIDNSLIWLATDDRGFGTLQRANGYTPARVSSHAFEFAVAGYAVISDAIAYTYQQEGHGFYVISFPSAGATWCLDVSTGEMHERPYRNIDGSLTRHRSNCQMNFAGLTLVGDWETSDIYSLDLDYYTDNGAAILSQRRAPHITNGTKYTFHHALELTMQTGVGLDSGQGSDPQAMLRWSDDGGYSWSNEMIAPIGKIGERHTRVKWRRLGKSRDRVYEVSITDPVKRVFTGCELTVTEAAA